MRHTRHFGSRPRRRLLGLHFSGVICFIAAAFWLLGLTWYAKQLPDDVFDDTTLTDAIVVLTGGSDRLKTGHALLVRGMAKKLFISGVYQGVDVHQLLEVSLNRPEMLECCVVLGHSAQDTLGNARETALWARRENISSIRLVTSNYHMPRSRLEFATFMPDIRVIPHPVFPQAVRTREWWRWPGTFTLLAGEFTKYLVAQLRHHWARIVHSAVPETNQP